jgi:hypothetical protein
MRFLADIPFPLDGEDVSRQVWDTAGQEVHRPLISVYLRGARTSSPTTPRIESPSSRSALARHPHRNRAVGSYGLRRREQKRLADSAAVDDAQAQVHDAHFFNVSANTGDGLDRVLEAMARTMAISTANRRMRDRATGPGKRGRPGDHGGKAASNRPFCRDRSIVE